MTTEAKASTPNLPPVLVRSESLPQTCAEADQIQRSRPHLNAKCQLLKAKPTPKQRSLPPLPRSYPTSLPRRRGRLKRLFHHNQLNPPSRLLLSASGKNNHNLASWGHPLRWASLHSPPVHRTATRPTPLQVQDPIALILRSFLHVQQAHWCALCPLRVLVSRSVEDKDKTGKASSKRHESTTISAPSLANTSRSPIESTGIKYMADAEAHFDALERQTHVVLVTFLDQTSLSAFIRSFQPCHVTREPSRRLRQE